MLSIVVFTVFILIGSLAVIQHKCMRKRFEIIQEEIDDLLKHERALYESLEYEKIESKEDLAILSEFYEKISHKIAKYDELQRKCKKSQNFKQFIVYLDEIIQEYPAILSSEKREAIYRIIGVKTKNQFVNYPRISEDNISKRVIKNAGNC